VFKQITEAYSILSDTELRQKYDRLIFGESATTSSRFENQEDYKYWESKQDHKEREQRIREKLSKYKDYKEFLKEFENH
jgi:DnaJ-class molecular chaperone